MLYSDNSASFHETCHDRLKSSFVLGCEQPPVATPKRKARRVNPVTGEVEGEAELMMTKFVEKFEKSCKVPPGGHTSRLW